MTEYYIDCEHKYLDFGDIQTPRKHGFPTTNKHIIINSLNLEWLYIESNFEYLVEIGKCPELIEIEVNCLETLDLLVIKDYKEIEVKISDIDFSITDKIYPKLTEIYYSHMAWNISLDLGCLPRLKTLGLELESVDEMDITNFKYIESVYLEMFKDSYNFEVDTPYWYPELYGKNFTIGFDYIKTLEQYFLEFNKELIKKFNLIDTRFERVYMEYRLRYEVFGLLLPIIYDYLQYIPKNDIYIINESDKYAMPVHANKQMEKLGYLLPPSRTAKSARK